MDEKILKDFYPRDGEISRQKEQLKKAENLKLADA